MNAKENARNINNAVASPEFKHAVKELAVDRLGIDARDVEDIESKFYVSDISDFLFMKIIDGELFAPKYKFILNKYMRRRDVRLGNNEYKYDELLGQVDNKTISDDNTLDDFNGEYLDIYAELTKVDQEVHKQVKVPEMILSNAWASAEKMIEFVSLQVQDMSYAIERVMELISWKKMISEATNVTLPVDTEAIEYFRAVTKQIEEYKTTSDNHFGIGAEGVITINTVSGAKTIQPDLYFNKREFILIVNTDELVDIKFDVQAVQYHAERLELGVKVVPLNFAKYKGFAGVETAAGSFLSEAILPTNTKMILVHRDALQLLEQFEYVSTVKGARPFSIQHWFTKIGTYKVKTKPILIYSEETTSTKGNKKQAK